MKILIFISSILVPVLTLAHGSVGTMKTSNGELKQVIQKNETIFTKDPLSILRKDKMQIIYTINKENSVTEFALANAIDNQWEIQKYAVPDSVIENSEFSQFIDKSTAIKEWVEIQPTNP